MKKVLGILLGVASLFVTYSVNAWAYPVAVNDVVKMSSNDHVTITYEGQYQAQKKINSTQFGPAFGVFCLELNEYFNPGSTYKVASISQYAVKGGLGGATLGQDQISGATKWLYSHFLSKDLEIATATTALNNGKMKDHSLQLAIWKLEDELGVTSNQSSVAYLKEFNNDTLAKEYFTQATLHNDFSGDIAVMNLVDTAGGFAQSQLIGTAPVPEPSTFVLLGAGLLGAVLYRRKKQQ